MLMILKNKKCENENAAYAVKNARQYYTNGRVT